MVYNYKELLKKYKNERQINNALKRKEIFRISRGVYSTEWEHHSLESICKKYPNAIVTGLTAYNYYDLTTDPGKKYYLTTSYKGTRIHDSLVNAYYQQDSTLQIGLVIVNGMKIYDKERMLIELFRNKSQLSIPTFKEIVKEYRSISNSLDGFKLNNYLNQFSHNKTLKNEIYNIIF